MMMQLNLNNTYEFTLKIYCWQKKVHLQNYRIFLSLKSLTEESLRLHLVHKKKKWFNVVKIGMAFKWNIVESWYEWKSGGAILLFEWSTGGWKFYFWIIKYFFVLKFQSYTDTTKCI